MKRAREGCSLMEALSPIKRLKISTEPTSPSKETRAKKGHHFLTACHHLLTLQYYNVALRLELPYSSLCLGNITQSADPIIVLPYEQEAFNIDVKSGMWTEALDVYSHVTKHNKIPSEEMMGDVLLMLLCARDEKQIFSDMYIVKRCQNLFKMTLDSHSPYMENTIIIYKNLLLSSFRNTDQCCYYTDAFVQQENILKTIIKMLEIDIENVDGFVKKQFETNNNNRNKNMKCSNSIEDLSVFERFDKNNRMKRIFIILELITDLLERDLAVWIGKHFNNPRRYIARPQKPLIVWLIWQSRLNYGMVNDFCRDIFKFARNLIKRQYSYFYVNVAMRLINILFQVFYLWGESNTSNYPEVGKTCETFADELFNIMKNDDIDFILKFTVKLKPKQLRCLMCIRVVKNMLKSAENNFIILANSILKGCLWNRFKVNGAKHSLRNVILPESNIVCSVQEKMYSKLQNLIDKHNIKGNDEKKIVSYEKMDSSEVTQLHFINACYLALHYYDEMYCIERILLYHDELCSVEENKEGNVKESSESSDARHPPLVLNTDCLKQYRLIVKTKREMCEHLEKVKKEYTFFYKLFKRVPFLQFE